MSVNSFRIGIISAIALLGGCADEPTPVSPVETASAQPTPIAEEDYDGDPCQMARNESLDCRVEALEREDQRLNAAYQRLLKGPNADVVRAEQRLWVAWMESHCQFEELAVIGQMALVNFECQWEHTRHQADILEAIERRQF